MTVTVWLGLILGKVLGYVPELSQHLSISELTCRRIAGTGKCDCSGLLGCYHTRPGYGSGLAWGFGRVLGDQPLFRTDERQHYVVGDGAHPVSPQRQNKLCA